MKILFPFVGDSVGGSHLSSLELIKTLRANKYEVVILLHNSNGPLSELLKKLEVENEVNQIRYFAGQSSNKFMILIGMIMNIFPLTKFIKKNNINIVHGNDLRINLTWSLATLISKAKYIWHQRTILSGSKFWKGINILCDHFIGISQVVIESAPNNISIFKKSMVYNAFETDVKYDKELSKNLIKKNISRSENVLFLGCVGRLVEYKNIDFVISSISQIIRTSNIPIHLLIVGNGSYEYTTYLKSLVKKLDLQDYVSFTGFLSNSSEIISGLDILIAPSGRDAFGRTIIEAMLQSTTVLVADKGGHKEIVEDEFNGLIYKSNCKKNFIVKLIKLIENEHLRYELAKRAIAKSTLTYSKQSQFLAIDKIYKSITF